MAERIQGLSIGLDLETAGIDRSLGEVKRSFKGLNASIKTNSNNMKYGEKSIASYEQNISTLNSDIEKQRKNLDDVGQKYKEAAEGGNENSVQAQKLAEEYNKQADNLNRLEHQLGSYTSELEEMKRQQEIANSGWTKTGEKLQSTGDKMSAVGGKVSGFGKKWTKVTGIIAGAVAGAGAAVFGLTNKITENAFELRTQAAEMGVSTDAYQEMGYWAEQNGISQQQMEKAVGRLNQRIGQAKDGNEKYQDALEGVGISLSDVKDGTLSTEDAFTQSIKNLSEMDDKQERVGKATELFGTRMARQLQPALEDGAISMDEARKKAEELGIVMSEDEIEASADFQASMVDIKASLSAMGREIGLSVMPYMQKFADYMMDHMPQIKETVSGAFQTVANSVKSVINWFQDLNPSVQKGIAVFSGIATAIGPASLALGGLLKVFGPITSAVGKAFTVLGEFGGILPVIKAGLAALTGPVGLTVAAIAGLTAGFVTAYNKSETFRNAIQTIGQKIMEFGQTIKPYIMQALNAVVDFMKGIGNQLKQFWNENKATITQALQNIMTVVKTVFNAIKSVIETVMPAVLAIIKSVWNNIKGVIQGTLDVIMGVVKTFSSLLTGDFKGMWEGIKQIFSGAIKAVWNFIQLQFFGRILKAVKPFASTFKKIFSTLWNGIKTIFKTTITAIFNFVKKWFTKTKNTIQTIFDAIKSFFSSIWKSIKGIFTSVIKSIVNFVKNRFNVMKGNITKVWDGIKSVTKSAWNGVKKFIINPIKTVVSKGKSMFNSFKTTIFNIWQKIKDTISDKITGMVSTVKGMPGRMKKGLLSTAKKVKDAMGTLARKMVSPLKGAVNGVIGGINWALKKVKAPKSWQLGKWSGPSWYAHGTDGHPSNSPAVVGDGKGSNAGSELITRPNGQSYMSPSKPTLIPMEKGTHVTPAKETKQMLANLPKYAFGTKGWDLLKTAGKKTKEGAKAAASKIGDGKEWVMDKGKQGAKKLMNLGLKAVGNPIPKGGDYLKEMVKGGANKVKDGGIEWMKGKLSKLKDKFMSELTGGINGNLFGKNFTMSSDYGNRALDGFHKGIDFAAPEGTPIEAVKGGKIVHAGEGGPGSGYNGYGKSVSVSDGDLEYLYGHMSRIYLRKNGTKVKKGTALGEVGQTGQATGPHVHFEVRKKGTLQTKDPNELFGDPAPDASGKGVKRWKSTVRKALKNNGLSTSGAMANKVLRQISTESGGNPKAIQGSNVMDVNMAAGNPARGLMQTIPSTFMSNKHKGHGDIMNGYDNLLAALRYAKGRYGKNLSGLGEGHGYKQGTNYVPQDGPAMLHKGEAVIPKKYNKKPTDAMKLLALVGKALNGETDKTVDQGGGKVEKLLEDILEKLDNAGINQTNHYHNTGTLSPAETARKNKKMLRQFAKGMR